MSFRAYLDNIENKTGLTPRQFIALAHEKGLDGPSVKAGAIVDWLKADHDLGAGSCHGPGPRHQEGPDHRRQACRHRGTHRDDSDTLWLDGKATRPQQGT